MKRPSPTQALTLGTIALFLLLPLVTLVVPFSSARIEGMPSGAPPPPWSLKAAKTGRYQGSWSIWALKGHPLWSWSVKITNELVYRLTGEISLDYGTSIQGGKEGFFWQPMYLRSFNRALPLSPKQHDQVFKDLSSAQSKLAKEGIPLLFVINPNVLMLYPEILPEKYKAVRPGPNGYEMALEFINKYSVQTVDTYSYLREMQPSFATKFFEPTGSHWNEVGSCLAVKRVGEFLGQAWDEKLPEPNCETYEMRFPPQSAEIDLVKIANLLRPQDTFQPGAYLTSIPLASPKKQRRVLLVGTSFLFGLERQLLRRKIAASTTLLFYYRQLRRDGKGPFRALDRKKITKETLLSYDAIIVDANVSNPVGVGYGFIQTVNRLFPTEKPLKPPKKAR